MFQITISVITGITMASWIQKKSQMINRHRDYVPLLLHFHGYIPFQSVCLCVCQCVCLKPHKSAIFQPIFKCDTWLDASSPRAGHCVNHFINYTGWYEKNAPKVQRLLFLCPSTYCYEILHSDSPQNYQSHVKISR